LIHFSFKTFKIYSLLHLYT